MRILVTGGAGFIGSALVRHLIRNTEHEVVNVDKLTYAGNLASLDGVDAHERHQFEPVDIRDANEIARVFRVHRPDRVVHLAAESHVDRSIDRPDEFISTNVLGTFVMLEAAQRHWQDLDREQSRSFRFLHVSTDEVFGALGEQGRFSEESRYDPSSPYAASKAGADHLVRAWHRTYGLPVLITNCSNNFGAFQFPEKLIPLVTLNALEGRPLPLYGRGDQVRDWLFVEDHIQGLLAVLENGRLGETYLIGGSNERTNLDVVRGICRELDDLVPLKPPGILHFEELIRFVADRPGHDRRYAIDPTKLQQEIGWRPQYTFESGLRLTVEWYLANNEWCTAVQQRGYTGQRLGLARTGGA